MLTTHPPTPQADPCGEDHSTTQRPQKSARTNRYTMRPAPDCSGDYPEPLLREWSQEALGAVRCRPEYLTALRIVLGSMARADRHGATLHLSTDAPFATRATMRTILGQLQGAGLVTMRESLGAVVYLYQGQTPLDDHGPLERLYREAEEAAFRRYRQSIGLCVGDVPY